MGPMAIGSTCMRITNIMRPDLITVLNLSFFLFFFLSVEFCIEPPGNDLYVISRLEDHKDKPINSNGRLSCDQVYVQEGFFHPQLGQLLRQAAERGDQGFDPSTALFVCNWWDQVNPRDQDHVLHETLRRLSRVLPGVGRQQVFPLSSTEVCHCYQHISQACLFIVKL